MTTPRLALAGIFILALAALPLAGEAQQANRVYHVGVVLFGGPHSATVDGLRDGLRELGFEEGKQYVLDVRDGKGDLKAAEAAAGSLEGDKVDVIVAMTTSITLAVKRATKSVPIVFYAGTDPVSVGLVESFRKPGGRLTGIHGQSGGLAAKRLELLKEMVPRLRRVVVFYRPDSPSAQQSVRVARDAARGLKLELVERPVASVEELRAGLRNLRAGEADALLYVADAMVASQTELIIESARAKRLPTMLQEHGSVAKGALAAYGESFYTIGRLSAKDVRRVLLGANPGELPVEQVDRLHFVINLKTAKALGLTIPRSLLARADEVIE
ncbi:MAG TPA: ABC transporter substrate-binding protein [Candidatus Nitrosotalea sp.]|jgi:putative ABC transport system substrate-binding protein|nr:ABC transporter substrate-binding protein [Candidatus Nitrosotalea sp.]